jgi:uncharacterized SAM-binding protein YcdF (DUF218 family)
MFFTLSKILGGIADPATLLAIFTLAGGMAILARRLRLAVLFQSISVAIVLFFGVLPGANWLALPLESRFPANPPLPSDVAGIIALGGTERLEQSAAWGQPIVSDPGPIVALINLGRRYPNAKLVFTGGLHATHDEKLSEADIVRQLIDELGADAAAITYEDRARNTHENAVFTYQLMHPKPGERWILICQAIGMPRAVGVFRRAGWNVIPFPAGYLSGSKGAVTVSFDLLDGLNLAYFAVHEWVGLIIYRLMGYTEEVFPG